MLLIVVLATLAATEAEAQGLGPDGQVYVPPNIIAPERPRVAPRQRKLRCLLK
jgi:hypothetical protein